MFDPSHDLTRIEEKIFLSLMGMQACSRSKIKNKVWGNRIVGPRTLNVHICNLKKRLKTLNTGWEISRCPDGSYILHKNNTKLCLALEDTAK